MVKRSLVLSLLSFIFFFYSCGERNSNNPQDESLKKSDPENFSDKMKDASENFAEGKKVNPVDFRDLKALLPESIGDLKRSNLEGEKVAAMGMNISHANADYSDADHTVYIDLKITDLGSVSGLSALAAYGWYMVDIDKENDTGYEKTITYKGNKGYEKYDDEGKYGELSVLVAKRFVIEANGNNILMDQLKAAVDMIDLAKLESWKDFGIEK
ncbi:MAG: transposase [Ignavibacterium sp.]|nr:transposase [Ignavibacterium sp.]